MLEIPDKEPCSLQRLETIYRLGMVKDADIAARSMNDRVNGLLDGRVEFEVGRLGQVKGQIQIGSLMNRPMH